MLNQSVWLYRAQCARSNLKSGEIRINSHDIIHIATQGCKKADMPSQTEIWCLSTHDKQQLVNVAATYSCIRPPELNKGRVLEYAARNVAITRS